MAKNKENIPEKSIELLFNKVANLIEQARIRLATAMNVAEVYTKYQIGRYIVGKYIRYIANGILFKKFNGRVDGK